MPSFPVDEVRDLLAEHLRELLRRVNRVFNDVMQERGRDRDVVDMELREDLGDVQRVDDVRLARDALLPLVRGERELVRPLDEPPVRARLVAFDGRDDGFDGHGFLDDALHETIPPCLALDS